MTNDERERDAQLKIAFGSTNPGLTRFPHCIFRTERKPAGLLSEVVNRPVGLWGIRCLVDAAGNPYLEPEDSRIVDDFKLWVLPVNQEHAFSYVGRSCGFTMLIPADTPPDVLRSIYDISDWDDGEFYYDKYIGSIASHIPALGWAYIPLYEIDYAILVATTENAAYVEDFRSRLQKAGIMVFDVAPLGDGQVWRGPLIWDSQAFFGDLAE